MAGIVFSSKSDKCSRSAAVSVGGHGVPTEHVLWWIFEREQRLQLWQDNGELVLRQRLADLEHVWQDEGEKIWIFHLRSAIAAALGSPLPADSAGSYCALTYLKMTATP